MAGKFVTSTHVRVLAPTMVLAAVGDPRQLQECVVIRNLVHGLAPMVVTPRPVRVQTPFVTLRPVRGNVMGARRHHPMDFNATPTRRSAKWNVDQTAVDANRDSGAIRTHAPANVLRIAAKVL